ncbi:MAG: glycoside hydrolase family 3 C-terminal domain-containing protein [Muribaculaceae bacterium]|nr:glycoside hydrolase family 3 C-terminal domain-containing protein [Muribaculaceae bacterium]
MTLEEKIFQLNQYTLGWNNNENNLGEEVKEIPAEIGSLIYFEEDPELRNLMQKKAMEESRLGIPILFGYDVIHGFRTIYPISLAQACSWNPALVKEACAVAAQESRMSGVDWTFSPMIDVARDPRWGRVSEGYGEDPYLNSVFGVASVEGYQGNNLSDTLSIAACLKHFVGYGASEAGRDYVYTEISPQTLWDTYLPPYEAGINAGAATVMSAFNDISGVPASANPYTLNDILKQKWNFDGFVVSDWAAINQLKEQGYTADNKEGTMRAINAGLDMDMMNHAYDRNLQALLEEGLVTQDVIDEAVRRILRVKFRLGLFENPYTSEVKDRFLRKSSLETASNLAAESMVLLKNDSTKVLPLKNFKKIAVIGPMAKTQKELLGSWNAHGNPEDVISFWEGINKEFGSTHEIRYAEGCDFDSDISNGLSDAMKLADWADIVIMCLGEKNNWSGENASRADIHLPAIQESLAQTISASGKPMVLILTNGRPLALDRIEPFFNAIVEAWQPGVAGGESLAGILSGRINPSGKLAMTFPLTTGQIPIYYNRRKSGRHHQGFYKDISSEPLYPFGHGLSYTDFEYSDIKISSSEIKKSDKVTATVSVKNIGEIPGYETVMWFVSDPFSTITRPVKELKHFEKVNINPGETREFSFEIDPLKDLGFVDNEGNKFVEPGDYYITVNDKRIKLTLTE